MIFLYADKLKSKKSKKILAMRIKYLTLRQLITFNMKISRLVFSCLAVAATLSVSSCNQETGQMTSNNPHAYVTDEDNARMISSLEELDPERLYVMNYTSDYKLDKLIEYGVESTDQMIAFLSENIFDVAPQTACVPTPATGCSAYAATNVENGEFYYGRNYDYCHVENGVEVPATAMFVRTAPEGGKKAIAMVDAYWLGYHKGFYNDGTTDLSMLMAAPYEMLDGMNEDGFAVCVLHLDGKATRQDEAGKQFIWANIFMRKLLDTVGSVEEAVTLAKSYNLSMKTPASGNLHFFVADATGDYAILEYSYADAASVEETLPNILKVFRGTDCDRYVTNFYVDPEMAEHPTLGPLGKHGLWRYDTLRVTLERNNYKLTDAQAMNLLKAVSQDSNPDENTSHTQWSALYNLTQKKVDVSILQEYENKFSFSIEK